MIGYLNAKSPFDKDDWYCTNDIVEEIEDGYILVLHHEHDGRDLELKYAEKVVKHITHLWGSEVKLITMVDDAPYEI